MVKWILQELIKLEFSQQIGTERYERSEERPGYHNGFRKGVSFPELDVSLYGCLEIEKDVSALNFLNITNIVVGVLVLALLEGYLQGESTRKMRRITEKLCGVEFKKDQVSRMAHALDEEPEELWIIISHHLQVDEENQIRAGLLDHYSIIQSFLKNEYFSLFAQN